MAKLSTVAIITAGGSGKRFGGDTLKQFERLGGKPLVAHALETFAGSKLVDEIIVVVPNDMVEYAGRELVGKYGLSSALSIVPGGSERQNSVQNGFNTVDTTTEIVIVHDGVRPFVSADIIEKVIIEASIHGAAIAALPANDTVKISDKNEFIERTEPRNTVWLAQTPQAFKYDVLKEAYEKSSADGFLGTDESILVERTGVKVKLVKGTPDNIKITTRENLELAELIYSKRTHT